MTSASDESAIALLVKENESANLVNPSRSFLYAHNTDLFCLMSTLDMM